MNPYRYAETCPYCGGRPDRCGGFGRCAGPAPEAPKAQEQDAAGEEQRTEQIAATPAGAR